MIQIFVVTFIICFLYKLFNSLIDLSKVYLFRNYYTSFLTSNSIKIHEYKQSCINLFIKLHIQDIAIPVSQPVGYGQLANYTASLFQNFPDKTNIFAPDTMRLFYNAVGICKRRIIECFSPKYWIDCIIFLPKNILLYLNVSIDSILIKFFQLFYWLIGITITIFSTDIAQYIKLFFTR